MKKKLIRNFTWVLFLCFCTSIAVAKESDFQNQLTRQISTAIQSSSIINSKNTQTQPEQKIIQQSFKYFETLPQMKPILKNLPDNISYVFSQETPGIASFDADENSITINPQQVDLNTPQGQLYFYYTVAHELCHANQKKEGLYFNDLTEASFGDTFRVAKMMETDARLLGVMVENELAKRKEFEGVTLSKDGQYYQQELRRSKGNVSQPNTNFVLTYWQNAANKPQLNEELREVIKSRYFFYTEQAYHQALIMHNPAFKQTPTNRNTALQAMQKYIHRMALQNVPAELFLQEKFDNTQTMGNFQDGITVLYPNGDKYMTLTPSEYFMMDKVTYFEDNQEASVFLRNGITGEMYPFGNMEKIPEPGHISQNSANLSALKIAIENRNMKRIESIIKSDPTVINRQMPVGKNFPLLMAIQNDNAQAVDFILSKKPNLLLETEDGRNVLSELDKLSDTKLQKLIKMLYVKQQKESNQNPDTVH